MRMEGKKRVGTRLLAMVLVLFVALAVAIAAVPAKQAFAENDQVRATAKGVMKFNWHWDGEDFSRGSCFLINENTVMTAYHCTMFSSKELEALEISGEDKQDLQDHMTYSVTINRDVTVGATLVKCSEEQDWAIYKLDQTVNNHTPLPIRDSSTVQAAETVYTVGFPANSDLKVINTYTSDDVTFKSGVINKAEGIYQGATIEGFDINGQFLQTDSVTSSGDSGGPVVDSQGNVIGIAVYGDANYYLAVASDVITPVMDDLGIKWMPVPDNTVSTDELEKLIEKLEGLKAADYPAEAYDDMTEALDNAKSVLSEAGSLGGSADDETVKATQKKVDAAVNELTLAEQKILKDPNETTDKEGSESDNPVSSSGASSGGQGSDSSNGSGDDGNRETGGFPTEAIIAIVIGIVLVVAIIAIALVMRSRKDKSASPAPAVAPAPAAAPAPVPAASAAAPTVTPATKAAALSADASATTILEGESTDTVLLFQAASGGSLTRMSSNEQIPINSAEFTIGRERNKVNYYLEGNDSISRIHARLVVRDDKTYLVDNRSANGTYINGVKCRPGEEILLNNGDVITIADEKFKYNK